jgi:hypothetical protein
MQRKPARRPMNHRSPQVRYRGTSRTPAATAAPLPVGQAIAGLPGQYLKVLTRPSSGTFREEKDRGRWAMVWIQLLGAITLGIAVRLLIAATSAQGVTVRTLSDQLTLLIGGPLLFFLYVGIQHRAARMFSAEKERTYLAQCYTTLLFGVPLGILASLFVYIPGMGRLLNIAVGLYSVVLTILSIKAVHHIGGEKALFATLAPMALLIVFVGCVFGFRLVVHPH